MPLPETYLSQAPSDATGSLGKVIRLEDFKKKLKRCNGQLTIPTPEHYEAQGWVFSGAARKGQTSLWWGTPPGQGDIEFASTKANKQAKKIVSFVLEPEIPEFTQFDTASGTILQKGWREILRRVVMSGAASKEKVEKVFKVSLNHEGADNSCQACRKRGLVTKAQGASMLCTDHHMATLGIAERQQYIDYLLKQMLLKGESQVGHTTKEKQCQSSNSTEAKLQPKTSVEPSMSLNP